MYNYTVGMFEEDFTSMYVKVRLIESLLTLLPLYSFKGNTPISDFSPTQTVEAPKNLQEASQHLNLFRVYLTDC
jgi:hypothetical protein